MSPVLIACPDTLDLVATGFEADSIDELEPRNYLEACPSCGATHEWQPTDAVISVATA